MTIIYSQNFDTTTVGTLPAGWTPTASAAWTVTNSASVSAPNALVGPGASGDGTTISYTGQAALADMEIRYDVGIVQAFVSCMVRASSDCSTGYLFLTGNPGNLNSAWNIYKRVGGAFTQIDTFTPSGLSGNISIRARAQGTTLSIKVWSYGTTEPTNWSHQTTDSSISAAGYPAFYNQGLTSTGGLSVVDNFTLDNLAAGLTAGTSSSSAIGSTTATVVNTGATGGTSPYTYQWYRSTTSGFTPGTGNIVAGATGLTLNDTGLAASTTYYYVLSATDSAGATALAVQLSVTTSAPASLANGAISSSAVGSTTATVIDAGATGGTSPYGYQWYRSTTSGFTPGSGNVVAGATSATLNDSGLTPSTAYYYKNIVTDNVGATATSSQLTVTTTAGSTLIPITNTSLFWSPGNWDHLTSGTFGVSIDTMQATAPGAYLKFGVSGTANVALDIDHATTGSFPSGSMPIVRYSIDGATFTDVQLGPTQSQLVLASGLTGSHSIEVFLKAVFPSQGDTWGSSGVSPTNVLRINGIQLDSAGSVTAPPLLTKRALIFGDSINAGEHVNLDGSDDATQSFAPMLGRALAAEFGQIGYGGQGWEEVGTGNVVAFKTAYALFSVGRARSFSGLDYVAVVHGTNDARGSVAGSTIQADIQAWLAAMRTACGASTALLVIVPPNAVYASNIAAGVAAYKTASGDTKAYAIDATALLPSGVFTLSFGGSTQWTYDGVHPLIYGHGRIGAAYAALAASALGGVTASVAGYSRSRIANA